MRVLYITNLPAPYKVKFFESLGKLCDLTVIYERSSAADRNSKWVAKAEHTYEELFIHSIKIGTDNSLSLDVIKYIKKQKYDCIVVGMYSTYTAMLSIIYMKKHDIPFWLSTDGGFVRKESLLKYRIKHYFISAAMHWLTTGKKSQEYLVYYGAKKDECYTYPFSSVSNNDVLLEAPRIEVKRALKAELNMEESIIVLSVGQFIPRKGYDILLKTWAELTPEFGLYLIGGVPTNEYTEIKERLKLNNVHFIDFKTKEELASYYKAADLFVLPTREDVWGLVVNEAMAYGLPVITTNRCIAGLEMITSPSCGKIINDIENTHLWATEIEDALRKLDDFSSSEILKCASQYTIEKMADETYRIISSTVKCKQER